MAHDLISVLIIGTDLNPTVPLSEVEAHDFNVLHLADDRELEKALVEFRPQVVLTVGRFDSFSNLATAPFEIRRRWLHFEEMKDPVRLGWAALQCYVAAATTPTKWPLISVITPTYLSGSKISRPHRSLLRQVHNNWEWVLFDDSPDDGLTFGELCRLAESDHRISVYRSQKHSGVIGEVKHRACMLAKGSILVELDHDDELLPDCLSSIKAAFEQFPDAGFAYTDCAEVFDDGTNASYDRWAFDYGSYRRERHDGRELMVTNYPNVNAKTIRHIVGAPNHARAWRKDAYFQISGHGRDVHVCDDYELILRTFLKTRMVKIPKLGYVQYYNRSSSGNTQRHRNKEIQRLVRCFRERYEPEIHKRLLELKVEDFIWTEKGLNWNVPNPTPETFVNYVAKI